MGIESKTIDGRRRWDRWSEREGRAAVAEFERSGQSAAVFARRKGVSTQRLVYWKKRLVGRGVAAFVAVPLPSVSGSSAAAAGSRIEVDFDGVVLRVREDLDVEHLARIVDALLRRARGC